MQSRFVWLSYKLKYYIVANLGKVFKAIKYFHHQPSSSTSSLITQHLFELYQIFQGYNVSY